MALAPEKFVDWLRGNAKADKHGNVYHYHSRSDAHSIALCKFLLEDLLERSTPLREQARRGEVVYGINFPFAWPTKTKALDLAIGPPMAPPNLATAPTLLEAEPSLPTAQVPLLGLIKEGQLRELYLSCEAKAVMTEHSKSKPRVYDELSSSHEIVHQGSPRAIATGIATVNIASSFVSPLRNQQPGIREVTQHKQPDAAGNMIRHLRALPIRTDLGQVGFDAFCTFVVELDNQTAPNLWTSPPAPQPGDRDHYETFLESAVRLYAEIFGATS